MTEASPAAILVHGGAGPWTLKDVSRDEVLASVQRAGDAGWAVLADGGSAMAAVEVATREMESDPLFDAGYGSYLNREGEIEVDAMIMDGRTLRFGAVAAVPHVRHPVTLARLVMSDSPHAILVGDGAEEFARNHGLNVPALDLVAPEVLAAWRRSREPVGGPLPATGETRDVGDTVGAVAIDAAGHVAAATSTGGMRDKWPGRVGDSPIVGSGAYADDQSGAVSCTGHGEPIMSVCLAVSACGFITAGQTAAAAADSAVKLLKTRTDGSGGLIVVDARGSLGWAWNTEAMPYAWRTSTDHGEGM